MKKKGVMCYKASLVVDLEFLEDRYEVKRNPKLKKRPGDYQSYHFNGFAHPEMLIIPQQNSETITDAYWGIMGSSESIANRKDIYAKAARYGGGLNARSEKAFDHFLYRYSIFEKRCIIPVSGFFEPHHEYHKVNGKAKKVSYPFYFEHRSEKVLSVAGIYTVTEDNGVTFAMLTKQASPLFEKVHNSKNRQIILLDDETEKEWLNPDLNESQIEDVFQHHYDDSQLETYPVSKKLNSTSFHLSDEEAIEKKEYPELEGFLATLWE